MSNINTNWKERCKNRQQTRERRQEEAKARAERWAKGPKGKEFMKKIWPKGISRSLLESYGIFAPDDAV